MYLNHFDANNDNALTFEEVKAKLPADMPPQHVAKIEADMKAADTDGDGKCSEKEIVAAIKADMAKRKGPKGAFAQLLDEEAKAEEGKAAEAA